MWTILTALGLTLVFLPWTYPLPPKSGEATTGKSTNSIQTLTRLFLPNKTKRMTQALQLDPAVVLDLAAAGIKAGASIPQVLDGLGKATGHQCLQQINRALMIGVDWEQAWRLLEHCRAGKTPVLGQHQDPTQERKICLNPSSKTSYSHTSNTNRPSAASATILPVSSDTNQNKPIFTGQHGAVNQTRLKTKLPSRYRFKKPGKSSHLTWAEPLQYALEPAWQDGISPENLLAGKARELSAQKDQRAKEAASRLAVKLVLPLGLCQLPAFILLGIVPNVLAGLKLF